MFRITPSGKFNLLLFFFSFLCLSLFGQTQKILFQSIRDGLSNQFVRCILKDSKGFMWFGTQYGLTRYDGVNFVVYENIPNDSCSLSYNSISSIYEDKNKNLWVGTFTGLNIYNREKDNFIRINQLKNTVISFISGDNSNNIWIGTIGLGLIKYHLNSKRIEYFNQRNTDPGKIISNHITYLLSDNKNRLWVGSWNGLYLVDTNGKVIKHFTNIPGDPESLSDKYVNALSLEGDSILWIGTLYGGLNKLFINSTRYKVKHYLNNPGDIPPGILSLFADKHNNLWIGTENKGLIRLNTRTGSYDQYLKEEGESYTLNSNLIRSIYIDDLNILWIGTLGRGVNFIDNRHNRFESFKKNPIKINTLIGNDVRCFKEDKKGNIWIATYDGICMFNVTTRKFTKLLSQDKGGLTTNAINSIVLDSDDNLWVGTWGRGIDRFDKNLVKTGNFKITGIQKVGENKINVLYLDSKNNLWVGTSGSGLFRYDRLKKSFIPIYDESKGVGPNDFGYVISILETSDNNLWIATAYKLFCLTNTGNNNYSFKLFANDNSPGSILSNSIQTLFEDHKKNLWIGSMDRGLFLYNKTKNSFIPYTKQDGLPGNTIFGILEDNRGNLWISTNKGIVEFNTSTKEFRNFTDEDGLVSKEFNANSCLRSKNGMFLFGSSEGFNGFYPGNLKENSLFQPVCFTDFKLFGQSVRIGAKGSPLTKSISETRKIVLTYEQSSFTIGFVTLNYIQGLKTQYAYILEGLEKGWNNAGSEKSASYTYVKPGKYVFKVKSSNYDGVWNDTPAILEIIILPPLWQTIWAYVLYLLAFTAVILTFIRYRIGRVKQIHLLELNQMKLQFFANISHELRTPLSLILSPIENIMAYGRVDKTTRTQHELIYRNANRLFRLVNEIMDFSKSEESKLDITVQKADIVKLTQEIANFYSDEALRRQINYHFLAEPSVIEAWVDSDKYEKIMLNLLSNAFKFTPDNGKISIKIEKTINGGELLKPKKRSSSKIATNELLKIMVTDNGKGISPTDINKVFERFYQGNNEDYAYQTGTGIGLSLTKTLVELHHGTITVTSEKGKATCFTILLPLGNSHFKKSEILTEPVDISSKLPETWLAEEEEESTDVIPPQHAPTILLVEDNYELRKYILSTFSGKYKVFEAADGEQGYKLATEHMPDLIISDIIMPNLSGIELCRQIKENIVTSHIPVILLTAKITLEDQLNGLETGADAYITKPFNVRYLEVITRNLIETRQKLYKRFSQDVYILPKEMSNNALDQHFLENIIEYIEDNITSSELSVENLASHLLMSPGHIWRKIKSLTGQSTNAFIRTIRLKKAVKLMDEGDLNVSEIAYKAGFSSPAYFAKSFRKQYGKSPSDYVVSKKKNG